MKNCINYKFTRIFTLAFSLIISSPIYTQDVPELDENFLRSLPSDIRTDVLTKMNEDVTQDDIKIFKAVDTTAEKLSSDLDKVKQKLADIEKSLGADSDNSLERFGTKFFSSYQTTFMPINDPNVSADYVLDFGDHLIMQRVGAKKEMANLVIARDGSINLPNYGRVVIAGLSLEKANVMVKTIIAEAFTGEEAFLTLSHMRDMSILVIGGVTNPGMYTVNGGAHMLYLLRAAGGIDENGSYRSIQVKRGNKIITTFDLYDVLIEGNLQFSSRMRSGDVVIVSPRKAEISVTGGVAYPGIFEITKNETVADALRYAGYPKPSSQTSVEVSRIVGMGRETIEVPLRNINNFVVQNTDSIRVTSFSAFSKPMKEVILQGEVVNPGVYTIDDGETLAGVIKRAGGYSQHAYEQAGILIRESAKLVEREINDRTYDDMIKFMATSANAQQVISGGDTSLPIILGEFKNVEPVGRITAEFDMQKIRNRPSVDTTLQDGDVITIPAMSEEIYVLGEVLTPGARQYISGIETADYIKKSGGISTYGQSDRIVVIKPNGDSYVASGFMFRQDDLLPGSIIYVPRKIGKLDGINLATVIAPIFSSLAISLASLNSISDS
jgi:protein involved in polysaccharide export with SLBB domain